MLDAITGDRPAYFESADGHSGWVNSAALKAAGSTPPPRPRRAGASRCDAQGNPTGVLRESAMELVSKLLPDYPDSQVDAGLTKALDEAYSYGITAIIDPAAKEWMLRGYQRFDADGKLKMRVEAAVEIKPDEGVAGVAHVLDAEERIRRVRISRSPRPSCSSTASSRPARQRCSRPMSAPTRPATCCSRRRR